MVLIRSWCVFIIWDEDRRRGLNEQSILPDTLFKGAQMKDCKQTWLNKYKVHLQTGRCCPWKYAWEIINKFLDQPEFVKKGRELAIGTDLDFSVKLINLYNFK